MDPETCLIRGLSESLKPIGIQLQAEIEVMPQGERIQVGLVIPSSVPSQEGIDTGRGRGGIGQLWLKIWLSSEQKGVRRAVTVPSTNPPGSLGNGSKNVSFAVKQSGRNIDHVRNGLWILG